VFIPVNEPDLKGNEKKYLCECIDTGWISSEGPFVKKFEEDLSSYVGRKHGIAVSNGSVALDVAITALGIGKDDEVILPSFTIISCAAAIIRSGAKPVVIDSNHITWNMDAAQIEAKINSKTKAIMIVHIYGLPVDMEPVLALAKKYNLKIIEDAAQSHGLEYKGKKCGSFGNISTFSFYSNKTITTGEGGMVLTDNDELAEKCRSLRNLCFQPQKRFVHEELGWNFRMSNIQAAIGVAQLEKIEKSIKRKREIGKKYNEVLSDIKGIQLPIEKTDYANNIYWVYGIVLSDETPLNAEKAIEKLQKKGIGSRPFFFPMHQQPVLKKMGLFVNDSLPVSENLYKQGFYIPSGLALTDEQLTTVAESVRGILK